MPVPTETFWNIRKLNAIFALSGIALFASLFLLIYQDWNKGWRQFQRDNLVWQAAMTEDAANAAISNIDANQIRRYEAELVQQQAILDDPKVAAEVDHLKAIIAEEQAAIGRLQIKTDVNKGNLAPLAQQIERRTAELGADHPRVQQLREDYDKLNLAVREQTEELARHQLAIDQAQARLDAIEATYNEARKTIDRIKAGRDDLNKKIALEYNPQGLVKFSQKFRNAPLTQWFNPSEQPKQVVVPDVRTDLNFMTVETLDRCMTCHVNIDDPTFSAENVTAFVERQIATYSSQPVTALNEVFPQWSLTFWAQIARQAGGAKQVEAAHTAAREAINQLIAADDTGGKTVYESNDELDYAIGELFKRLSRFDADEQRLWHRPVVLLYRELQDIARQRLEARAFKSATDLYRTALIEDYNKLRGQQQDPLPPVSVSPVLLAHPNLDLFVHPESPHKMSLMGCTVCHEGAGQETQFQHTVHTPREIWVDADTGAPLPEMLIVAEGTKPQMRRLIEARTSEQRQASGPTHRGQDAQIVLAAASSASPAHDTAEDEHSRHHAPTTYADLNLIDPHDAAPFAPHEPPHGVYAAYEDPSSPGTFRYATRQVTRWTEQYNWHVVHYMHWEKPMHALDYTESSCNKCHTEVYDLQQTAPTLYEGRTLFAQLGCVNCHAVTDLEDDLDIKRVGPSLVHVANKLSPEMLGSWIWAPKAFRPFARMPHYFMLENNSSPGDILRTRVEVAAMTHYLLNAQPDQSYYRQQKQPVPIYNPELPPDLAQIHELEAQIASWQARLDADLAATEAATEAAADNGDAADDADDPADAADAPASDDQDAQPAEADAPAAPAAEPLDRAAIEARIAEAQQQIEAIREAGHGGDVAMGRALFNNLGCLACHVNMQEHGEEMIVEDLDTRELAVFDQSSVAAVLPDIQSLPAAAPPLPEQEKSEREKAIDALVDRIIEAAPTLPKTLPLTGDGIERYRAAIAKTLEGYEPDLSGKPEDVQKRLAQKAEQLATQWSDAKFVYDQMSYNQRHTYALVHLEDQLTRTGPELSGVGTKLKAGRTATEARAWLYDWLRNPRHYSDYTIMPSFRLSESEANDLTAYLLSLERPEYEVVDFTDLGDHEKAMLEELVTSLLAKRSTRTMAEQQVATKKREDNEDRLQYDLDGQLTYLGDQMIRHYGCTGCHAINGMEMAVSACTNLDDWGLKDPHKLDFGYFDYVFERQRESTTHVHKVRHEGLSADATTLTPDDADRIEYREIGWEHMGEQERRPWLYHKLHNTRLYDRGKYPDSQVRRPVDKLNLQRFVADTKPYDKLKMPKYHLTDDQVHALVTFVTSIRKPLVSDGLLAATYTQASRDEARGSQVATLYNCYACHNIEGNEVHIQQFYDVHNPDGSFNYENLNNAPPRLVGQGAKTKPDWLFDFLQNVHPLRPWLQVRMPSFPLTEADGSSPDAAALVDYFAGWSQTTSEDADVWLTQIDDFVTRIITDYLAETFERNLLAQGEKEDKARDQGRRLAMDAVRPMTDRRKLAYLDEHADELLADAIAKTLASPIDYQGRLARAREQVAALTDDRQRFAALRTHSLLWHESQATAPAVERLRRFARRFDIVGRASMLDREALESQLGTYHTNWNDAYVNARVLQKLWDIDHPYIPTPMPPVTEVSMERGRQFFEFLACTSCHAVGDEQILRQLWEMKDAERQARAAELAQEQEAYEDDPYAVEDEEDEGYGEEEDYGYGDDEDYGYGDDDDDDAAQPDRPRTVEIPQSDWQRMMFGYSAPNLGLTNDRLQWNWVYVWLQEPAVIQPGTSMPQWFPHGSSALSGFNARMRAENEKRFGYTGDQQMGYLMSYMYTVGRRNLTPGAEALTGIKTPTIELPEAPRPAVEMDPLEAVMAELGGAGAAVTDGATASTDGTTDAEAVDEEPVAVVEQAIELQADAEAPYEGTRITGKVTLEGRQPPRRPIDMSTDSFCVNAHEDVPLVQEVVANTVEGERRVQFAFVRVKSGLPAGQSFEPQRPAVLDQHGCIYVPHVMGVMTGQTLTILNSDNTLHNVKLVNPQNNPMFNETTLSGASIKKTFNNVEALSFACDVHAWMNGTVYVEPHPFFATTTREGVFEITGLPPGDYELEVVHEFEHIAPVTFNVTVKEGTSVRADATLTSSR